MLELVTRNLREVITVEELRKVMEKEEKRAYIGFEPSGFVHLGWLMCGEKIKDLVKAGFNVTILLADWHAWINDKLNGNMDAIRTCGEYIKDAFAAMGVEGVNYIYASDMIKDESYWQLVLKIAKNTSLARVRRAMDIMGRKAEEAEKDFNEILAEVKKRGYNINKFLKSAKDGGLGRRTLGLPEKYLNPLKEIIRYQVIRKE